MGKGLRLNGTEKRDSIDISLEKMQHQDAHSFTLSQSEATQFFDLIRGKIQEVVGPDESPDQEIVQEVAILAEFVWQMILEPSYGHAEFKEELLEFLGDQVDPFLQWLDTKILNPLRSLREQAGEAGVQIEVVSPERNEQTTTTAQTATTGQTGFITNAGDDEDLAHNPENTNELANTMQYGRQLFKVKKRCKRFPTCPFGELCRFIHPTELCSNFPNCTFCGDCFFIHPEITCKFGERCYNAKCNYTHPEGWTRPEDFTSHMKEIFGGQQSNSGEGANNNGMNPAAMMMMMMSQMQQLMQ